MRTNLTVPYAQKDDAKSLGARWDGINKVWYIEDKEDLTPFMRWMNREQLRPHSKPGNESVTIRVDLAVPKEDRKRAKKLGVKWDGSNRQTWYVELHDGKDIEAYRDWIVTADGAKTLPTNKSGKALSVEARIQDAIRSGANTILVGVTVGEKYKPSASTECPF